MNLIDRYSQLNEASQSKKSWYIMKFVFKEGGSIRETWATYNQTKHGPKSKAVRFETVEEAVEFIPDWLFGVNGIAEIYERGKVMVRKVDSMPDRSL